MLDFWEHPHVRTRSSAFERRQTRSTLFKRVSENAALTIIQLTSFNLFQLTRPSAKISR